MMLSIEDIMIGWQDYPTPDGCSINVFIRGCDHACPQCSNPELWLIHFGKLYTVREVVEVIHEKSHLYRTNKICLFGGDPLYFMNRKLTKELIEKLKDRYRICLYTGYEIDDIKEMGISGCEFYKTGTYDHSLRVESIKTDEYFQLASTNQKLYSRDWDLLSQNGRYYFNKKEKNV